MRIFYFPLEPYEERYTAQLSGGKGWMVENFKNEGVEVLVFPGQKLGNAISTGSVLDGCGRGFYATSQIANFLHYMNYPNNGLDPEDILYFDDFWHPGIEAIPYAYTQMELPFPRMYAFCWAQSVDEFDFTTKMLPWIRIYEIANSQILEGIFCATPMIKDLLVRSGIGHNNKVHAVGLPYNSRQVLELAGPEVVEKKQKVVYTSRWDREKRPEKFLRIIDAMHRKDHKTTMSTEFVITTSSPKLRSNEGILLSFLEDYKKEYPNLVVKEGLSKKEYYQELKEASIQVNTADQDWVSWTLLEALTFNCLPVYPRHRSFPEVFQNQTLITPFLYSSIEEAVESIITKLNYFKEYRFSFQEELKEIYLKYDTTVQRMVKIMKGEWYDSIY